MAMTTSHTAVPAQVTASPNLTAKRGHTRSASLENANSFLSKNTLGLPIVQAVGAGLPHTGTLKSRNEQKRMRNKFGSHSNLDDFMQQGRAKFQNIRQMFEITKRNISNNSEKNACQLQQQQQQQHQQQMMQSLPSTLNVTATTPNIAQQLQNVAGRQSATQAAAAAATNQQATYAHQQLQQQQQQQQHAQPQTRTQYQQQHSQQQQHQQQQRSASGLSQLQQRDSESSDQATNLIRPIAFKPIPFEPDYSISNRFVDVDRYGSTPSLVPVQGANMRFGSTTDLRHGGISNAVVGGGGMTGSFIVGGSGSGVGVGAGIGAGAYSSSNYCNSLLARRRGSRSLKINDSMESIRHTPDSDANSQSSTIKSNCSIGNGGSSNNNNNNNNNKYTISEQCDMTPSPSDSGISELEAALKDRDSELSYLRQTMEHNEKDKETFWENETKRLKAFYEGQQREYLLKMKKMDQMLAMQQFQLKQHKMRHTEQVNKLREQLSDMKNENEILRSNSSSVKNSERNLKDRVAFIEEELEKSEHLIGSLKAQLEESEWKVCERNGEIALLKTQLKEANLELTMKEHAIVHLKHENTNVESQIYQSLQENHNLTQQQRQIEEQKAQSEQQVETEIKQLNKIVILKDQVILALTNELAKLRKELSDLAISHEYGEEPSGKFTRLKQQLDNLTEICQKTRKHAKNAQRQSQADRTDERGDEDVVDAANIELIMNCLKLAPAMSEESDEEHLPDASQQNAEQRLAKMSADIQKFVYGSQNLPDIAVNAKPQMPQAGNAHNFAGTDLDTLIKESASYAEEIAKLRQQLDNVRVNFELEKQQWCEEKEKVLCYQKQLQAHYINMYQKLRSLENLNIDKE